MSNIDWIGAIGAFLILISYFLNVTGRISTNELSFILLNLIGAAMACIASALLKYLPFVILEGVWALVSMYALLKYKRKT